MAQETDPTGTEETAEQDATQIPAEHSHDSALHYYSGGEIREHANTEVGGFLTTFWLFLIIVCAASLVLFGGVLKFGRYQPEYGSQAKMQQIQTELSNSDVSHGVATVNVLDLDQVNRPAGQTTQQAIDAGSDVYQNYCIGCHGPNQDGNGINAQSLNPKPRNLHDAPFIQAMSYQRINTSVHKGVPGTAMPRWENTLTDRQIADVIVYVFSLTSPPPGSASAMVPASPLKAISFFPNSLSGAAFAAAPTSGQRSSCIFAAGAG